MYAGDGLGDFTLPPTGRLLRAVYAQAIAHGRADVADRIGYRAGVWLSQIRAMLAGYDQANRWHPLRDHACTACGETYVVDERDGEHLRIPAVQVQLAVVEETGERWPYLVCQACGDNGWLPYRADSDTAALARLLVA
jgi:hypothetical protein